MQPQALPCGYVDMFFDKIPKKRPKVDITTTFPNLSTTKIRLSTAIHRLFPYLSTKNWSFCGKTRQALEGIMGYLDTIIRIYTARGAISTLTLSHQQTTLALSS
jgi:hypothetical protein